MAYPTKDIVHPLAACAADTCYEGLPTEAIEAAKKSILDTLGVILAASGTEPAVRGVIDLVREGGGRSEASVLAFGGKAPAMAAAFANGAMAHCLDYDDQTPWGQHCSSSIVPAALAVAERQGGVRGADLIAAVAAGQDLFARLRRNVGWRKDWNLSTVLGVFAATVAAGRVLGLSGERLADALGIASMQSSGVMEVVAGTGSDLRAMYAGFSARGAVTAALLADKGITGVPDLFEGEHGVLHSYFAGTYDREAILADLGTEYQGGGTLYKPWPAVGTAHSHIHATIGLMDDHGLSTSDIEELRVHVGDYHDLMCRPLDARRAPATLVDAKFSLPFLVALAAVRRTVRVSDFFPDALRDPEVLDVARRVVPVADRKLDWTMELPPGRVELRLRDGRHLIRTGTDVPGSAEVPMTWDGITRKFEDCASAAVRAPSAGQVRTAIRLVRDLEASDDATEVVRALATDQIAAGQQT
ncbi:MmgE/PrpD family protein [Streptomyces sp. NPDC048219]|uniref:MmgE/PrpD family protein n=1 Tax=Streptomyces sp. NPDC048219 TaxID=3365517 RepID=UPI0037148DDE